MKYRKKPVVVDAIQFIDDIDVMEQLQEELGIDPVRVDYKDPKHPVLKIETLEGMMIANVGDYVIKGVNGEFYPCKPDIFKKTYELVK
jgi:hypothetical protein